MSEESEKIDVPRALEMAEVLRQFGHPNAQKLAHHHKAILAALKHKMKCRGYYRGKGGYGVEEKRDCYECQEIKKLIPTESDAPDNEKGE